MAEGSGRLTQWVVGAVLLGAGFAGGSVYQSRGTSASTLPAIMMRDACEHDYTSDWTCPDSIPNMMANAADILGGTLTVDLRSGEQVTIPVRAGSDALFLTVGSTTDFLVRYYDATDQRKATELRQRLGVP